MAETDLHRNEMADLIAMLDARYHDAADVYVSGNLFVYYRQGDPSGVMAPDVFVAFGVPKGLRRTYKVWEEGGVVPAVVIEATTRKTRREDLRTKKATCARLGVAEYWLYDPYGEYLIPPLQGFRLVGSDYVTLGPDHTGGLPSTELGLSLRLDGRRLVLTDALTGEQLLRPSQAVAVAEAERRGAELARRRAESERRRAEAERQRAEAEWQRAEEARSRAAAAEASARDEQRRTESAEAEVARLRAEIGRLHGDQTADR
jgi:Uma2 family endonuclease